MKAIIEKRIDDSMFNRIVYVIGTSDNEDQLRRRMKRIFLLMEDSVNYSYGFGGSHMWVHNKENERIILVEL